MTDKLELRYVMTTQKLPRSTFQLQSQHEIKKATSTWYSLGQIRESKEQKRLSRTAAQVLLHKITPTETSPSDLQVLTVAVLLKK